MSIYNLHIVNVPVQCALENLSNVSLNVIRFNRMSLLNWHLWYLFEVSIALAIFFTILVYFFLKHISFLFSAIPMSEPKTQPEIYFFEVVGQANTFFHLFEKQFSDSLIPLVR